MYISIFTKSFSFIDQTCFESIMKTTAFSLLLCLSFWSYQPKAISVGELLVRFPIFVEVKRFNINTTGNPIIFEEDTDTCLTPDRKTGLCIDFEDCGSLKKLLECSSREVLDYLRISVCGFSLGFNSKVKHNIIWKQLREHNFSQIYLVKKEPHSCKTITKLRKIQAIYLI